MCAWSPARQPLAKSGYRSVSTPSTTLITEPAQSQTSQDSGGTAARIQRGIMTSAECCRERQAGLTGPKKVVVAGAVQEHAGHDCVVAAVGLQGRSRQAAKVGQRRFIREARQLRKTGHGAPVKPGREPLSHKGQLQVLGIQSRAEALLYKIAVDQVERTASRDWSAA